MELATQRYAESVELAGAYLVKRGLTEEIAEIARLGYVADPVAGHEALKGRLCIPYLTVAGVVQLKFRCIEDHNCKDVDHPKYLYDEGQPPRLYNVLALLESNDVVVITEGEIDALSVHHLVGIPAVGAPGVSSWKPFWHRLFAGHPRIIVVADGDDPGVDFARSLVDGNGRRDLPALEGATLIRMPAGDDSNSFIVREGTNAFRAKLGLD